jgi:predicted nucleic acid-binding protein
MADTVVDSCVLVKWVLPEVDSPHAQRLLTESAQTGERLIVLDLAYAEATNAIWKQHYRGITTLDQSRLLLDKLVACPVHVESAQRLLRAALEIAAKYRRAIYDSMFVALANDLNLRGITSDEPLYNAVHADYPNIVLLRNWQP